jgi:hypothetical protein
MKIIYNREDMTYSISGLSVAQASAIYQVLMAANARCFDEPSGTGLYFSGNTFECALTDSEREGLFEVCEYFDGQLCEYFDGQLKGKTR